MAYRLDRRVAVLEFADGVLEGSEVRCRLDISLGQLFAIQAAADARDTMESLTLFARHALLSWDIEDESGEQIPATEDGLRMLPISVCNTIIVAWIGAVSATPLVS